MDLSNTVLISMLTLGTVENGQTNLSHRPQYNLDFLIQCNCSALDPTQWNSIWFSGAGRLALIDKQRRRWGLVAQAVEREGDSGGLNRLWSASKTRQRHTADWQNRRAACLYVNLRWCTTITRESICSPHIKLLSHCVRFNCREKFPNFLSHWLISTQEPTRQMLHLHH